MAGGTDRMNLRHPVSPQIRAVCVGALPAPGSAAEVGVREPNDSGQKEVEVRGQRWTM